LTLTSRAGKYSLLEDLYKRHNQLHRPTVLELLDVLKTLVGAFKATYIVADALDESSQFDDVSNIIESILGWKMPNCHLLITSRRETYLDILYQYDPLEVVLSENLVSGDIELYTHETVGKVQKFRKWDRGLEEEIIGKLIGKAGGM